MFNRSLLAKQLQEYEAIRKKQSYIELWGFVAAILVIGAVNRFVPTCSYVVPIGIVLALVAELILINVNTKRAIHKTGLTCPACSRPVYHGEALHMALHDVCMHCNATIYRT